MTTFVDASAFYALLAADDAASGRAEEQLRLLLANDDDLLTTNYVVVETAALVQRRIGVEAVRDLHERLVPLCRVEWLDETVHEAAMSALLAADRRTVSLVDWTSFTVMRRDHVERAFAFDADFAAQGFVLVP